MPSPPPPRPDVYANAPNLAGCGPSLGPNSPGWTHAKLSTDFERRKSSVTCCMRPWLVSSRCASAPSENGPSKLSTPAEPSGQMTLTPRILPRESK